MLTFLALGTALIPSSYAGAMVASPIVSTSDALITPGPQIELLRKQNDISYMGWVSYNGTWSTEICDPGNTYYQADGQWACCATTKAGCTNLAVGCQDGNMLYRNTASGSLSGSLSSRACTAIWTASTDRSFSLCNTAFMFENEGDSNPKVNIVCGVSALNWSYYRQAPQRALETTTSRSSPFSSLLPLASRLPSSALASSTSSSSPTVIISLSGKNGGGKSKSKAWIAGAVIGPLLGLALIGGAIFFFMRRKKNKGHNQHVAPAAGSMPPAGATAYQQNSYPIQTGSPSPPQYYQGMQQNPAAATLGVAKQDGYYGQGGNPQSPVTSEGSQSPYGAHQQWQQPGGQQVYNVPTPSMSQQPQTVQQEPYMASYSRPFSSELEGTHGHAPTEMINVQPKK
ncbi:hypothetical protein BDU57DRAFT_351297 [Ampelomyces quisqualis]|uniref:Mid2 domain-containing protein n=1 Tax=Ampelomyces quisqualis TaxID=50730 RepID=A0A6A5QCM3_AMPQU|nr:hypothetical protein BDU57DRAFT_351297 [Ampelomyces quisqualis]